MTRRNPAVGAIAACAVMTMSGCSNSSPLAPAPTAIYQVHLQPEGTFQSSGMMQLEIAGENFVARVQAVGVDPGQRIPQHIHLNPTCNPGGGILLNLDQGLTVAGEGPGVGAAYPVADASGRLNYEATRSIASLIAAVNTHFSGANVQSTEGLLAFLNLENRNGHMHVSAGPPYPAVNCGEVIRVR